MQKISLKNMPHNLCQKYLWNWKKWLKFCAKNIIKSNGSKFVQNIFLTQMAQNLCKILFWNKWLKICAKTRLIIGNNQFSESSCHKILIFVIHISFLAAPKDEKEKRYFKNPFKIAKRGNSFLTKEWWHSLPHSKWFC